MDKFPIFFEIFRTIILEFCFGELFLSHIYYDALRDFVPFVLFKKRENTHGEVLLLVKPVTLLKQTLHHRCFSRV